MNLPSLAQIEDAQSVVYRSMPPTPQYSSLHRGRRIGVVLTGGNVDTQVFARVLAEGCAHE